MANNKKFTLIRVDCDNPNKINLEAGVHVFGRGKLLDVDDKRISRKHGQLEVIDDSLSVKALHQNPCFYKREGSSEIQVLGQNDSIHLKHGDQLGLLSGSYWFEVLHLTSNGHNTLQDNLSMNAAADTNEPESRIEAITQETASTEPVGYQTGESLLDKENEHIENRDDNRNESENPIESNEIPENESQNRGKNQNESGDTVVNNKEAQGNKSPNTDSTAIDDLDETNFDEAGSPSVIPQNVMNQDEQSETAPTPAQQSPLKRPHDSDEGSSDGAKKCKVDSDVKPQVKTEPTASSSNSNNNIQPSVQVGLRERCMYGSSCYRRNPAHRLQYSHPCDADWGEGERAPCPRGAACAKRDPRHWRDHHHPPGVQQPPPPPAHAPAPLPGTRDNKKKRNRERSETPPQNLIVTGKRNRKPIARESFSASDDSETDPFHTDEESEWECTNDD